MELRPPSYFALASLIDGPLHGYGIMQRASQLSDGSIKVTTGTLYSLLDRAMDEGLVTAGDPYKVSGRQRRDYTLTAAGHAALAAEADRMTRAARVVESRIRTATA